MTLALLSSGCHISRQATVKAMTGVTPPPAAAAKAAKEEKGDTVLPYPDPVPEEERNLPVLPLPDPVKKEGK